MLIEIGLLIIGLLLLIKGADYLVESSTIIARHFGISELIIGLTIVALGTSLPELIVGILSSYGGYSGISVSNIIGSNIFNVFIIVAIIGFHIRYHIKDNNILERDALWLMASAVWFTLMSMVGRIDIFHGLLFLTAYLIYLVFLHTHNKKDKIIKEKIMNYKHWLVFLLGMVFLYIGGKLTVDNAVEVAKILGVSEWLIGATIIAAGTSFPEAATSLIAIRRKKFEMSLGNIIGSNIFNIFVVMGVASIIRPILIDFNAYALHYFFLLGTSIFITLLAIKGSFHKRTALLCLAGYIVYILLVLKAG